MSFYEYFRRRTGEPPASLNAMYHITEGGREQLDRAYDVTARGRLLAVLADEGSMTGQALANRARLNNAQAQIWLTKLEKWGLVSSTGGESYDMATDGHRNFDGGLS